MHMVTCAGAFGKRYGLILYVLTESLRGLDVPLCVGRVSRHKRCKTTSMRRIVVTAETDQDGAELDNLLNGLGLRTDPADELGLWRTGPFTSDRWSNTLIVGGRRVPLTPKEAALFCYLSERAGEVVSREELLGELWGAPEMETRTVDTHMAALRRKVEGTPRRRRHLLTICGRGYQFQA